MKNTIDDKELDKVSGGISDPDNGERQNKPDSNCDNCFSQKCLKCSECIRTSGNLGNMGYMLFKCKKHVYDEWYLTMAQYDEYKHL